MTLVRHAGPVLTRDALPEIAPSIRDPSSVFNPGAVRTADGVALLLRVQTRGRETFLVPARSADGVRFAVAREAARIEGLDRVGERVYHVYDPRLTRLGGTLHAVCALDTDTACRLAVFRAEEDLSALSLVSCDGERDQRNGVLFPERVGGRFLMLRRPNRPGAPGEPFSGEEIELAESDDLLTWRPAGVVMRGRPRYFDERIGSGPPPVKTREGWLHLYHGVATHFGSVSIYQAGAVLLDLEDPARVLARTRDNLLEPREPWEQTGQVPNVVFPSGLVVLDEDAEGFARPGSRVLVYYGAADTCVGLAEGTVAGLLAACREG